MCSGTFWGGLLVVLGGLIILKAVFNINIPLFRILFALMLIYFGFKILLTGFHCNRISDTVMFGESKVSHTSINRKYKVIFGSSVIDFTGISVAEGTVKKEIKTVFGETVLKISPETPVKVVVNSAFAGANMPDGNTISFGKYTYLSKNFKETENHLIVEADVVFGSLQIISD